MNREDAQAIRRARWVERYRLAHPDADRWANSPSGIRHSIETQDRIFRMAEQLHQRGNRPEAAPFFPVLKAVDEAASSGIGPNEALTPPSAAVTGLIAYRILFGTLPPVRDHAWPAGCELTDEAEAELATFGLRARGFDPIVFDGTDPAACVWALFEIGERQAACDEVVRHNHRACPPRGLAVIATPVQRQSPAPVRLHHSPQPAGVGR